MPEDRRIEFRIGVHLGDVVEEADGDLMGDGVNVAARLESVAKPGAICLSEDAYRQVRGRLELKFSDLGPTQLKNIAVSIRWKLVSPRKPSSRRRHLAPPQRRRADYAALFRLGRHSSPRLRIPASAMPRS